MVTEMDTEMDITALKKIFSVLSSKELPSEKFYQKLNVFHLKLSQHYKVCESLKDPYKNVPKIKKLCAKLVSYLKNIYAESKEGNFDCIYCKLLSFWVYDQLLDLFPGKDTEASIVFANFQVIWNDIIEGRLYKSIKDKCNPYSTIVTDPEWKDRKELYDYCIDCDTIIELSNSDDIVCRKYHKYIKDKKKLYDKFDKLFSEDDKLKCPIFYNKCKGYDLETVLPKLNCHSKILEEEASSAKKLQSDLLNPTGNSVKTSLPATKLGDVLLGVVVTSMASGAIYRFTPIGNRLRANFGNKTLVRSNLNGGGNALLDYTSDSFNPYYENREEHYIGYHST
ncbi:PIR protein [Plasmodium vivax]|uniref:VIR protein n=1 Tax=Plasmodium vivax TaxID=5855 RepID=A0A565A6Q2_PLAVI|nr:PIR protein [Plasmodium vivax]